MPECALPTFSDAITNGGNGNAGMVQVEGCPVEDIFVQTQLKELNVSWEEPTFVPNGKDGPEIVRIERNLKPGQVMAIFNKNFL
jgi:hypothetical protein